MCCGICEALRNLVVFFPTLVWNYACALATGLADLKRWAVPRIRRASEWAWQNLAFKGLFRGATGLFLALLYCHGLWTIYVAARIVQAGHVIFAIVTQALLYRYALLPASSLRSTVSPDSDAGRADPPPAPAREPAAAAADRAGSKRRKG